MPHGQRTLGAIAKVQQVLYTQRCFETSEKTNPSERSGYFQAGALQQTFENFYMDSEDYKERRILTKMMLQHTDTICSELVKIL